MLKLIKKVIEKENENEKNFLKKYRGNFNEEGIFIPDNNSNTLYLDDSFVLNKKNIELLKAVLTNKNNIFEILIFRSNKIVDRESVIELAKLLRTYESLKTFEWRYNKDIDLILPVLKNKNLKKLDLGGNKIGEEIKDVVEVLIKNESELEELNLYGNRINKHNEMVEIIKLLEKGYIKKLDLSKNKFQIDKDQKKSAVRLLADFLRDNNSLTSLSLEYTGPSKNDLIELYKSLIFNKYLETLHLGDCNLIEDGVSAEQFLRLNTIKNLSLSIKDVKELEDNIFYCQVQNLTLDFSLHPYQNRLEKIIKNSDIKELFLFKSKYKLNLMKEVEEILNKNKDKNKGKPFAPHAPFGTFFSAVNNLYDIDINYLQKNNERKSLKN